MVEADPEIGVVIIDDHRMFAESLARLLADEEGITVVGTAQTGVEGIELVGRLQPRVALVDYHMPDIDGVQIITAIKRRDPTIMVVMLTASTDDQVLLAAIDAACSGFLTKDRAADEVAIAVRAAAAGEALISAAVLARLLPRLNRVQPALGPDLTAREHQILELLAQGWTNRAIAAELHLSLNTVRNYVQYVLAKLGAHSKLEAVSTAVRTGLISYPTAS
jgi:DNA-binding NarL/FixJ family response regulator